MADLMDNGRFNIFLRATPPGGADPLVVQLRNIAVHTLTDQSTVYTAQGNESILFSDWLRRLGATRDNLNVAGGPRVDVAVTPRRVLLQDATWRPLNPTKCVCMAYKRMWRHVCRVALTHARHPPMLAVWRSYEVYYQSLSLCLCLNQSLSPSQRPSLMCHSRQL